MSRNSAVKFGAVIFTALLALGAMKARHSGESSITHKLGILKHKHDDSGPRRTAKLTGPMSIRLELRGEMPKVKGDTYRVAAILKADQNLSDVKLNWILGPSVELVSGSPDYSLSLVAHEDQEVELILRATAAGPQRVQARAISLEQDARFAVSAHFNSQPPKRDFTNKND